MVAARHREIGAVLADVSGALIAGADLSRALLEHRGVTMGEPAAFRAILERQAIDDRSDRPRA